MAHPPTTLRFMLVAISLAAGQAVFLHAAEPARIVLQNGKSIPITALTLQAEKFVVKTASDGFNPGNSFSAQSVDHVYGIKPPELNQGIALLLTGKPDEARKLLEPIVSEHRITAKIPGNFWFGAARALLVAHAVSGNAAECSAIGKEISDSTPQQGADSIVFLGKALLMPPSTKFEDRDQALQDLTTGTRPADICAYASFFRGELLRKEKRDAEALEAYLSVPCLYPSGGLILNAAAEIQAADLLTALKRRDEARLLLNSALRVSAGTVLAEEANKRVENLK
jgi:hypothetical protein